MCFYVLTSVEEIKFSLLPQGEIAGSFYPTLLQSSAYLTSFKFTGGIDDRVSCKLNYSAILQNFKRFK